MSKQQYILERKAGGRIYAECKALMFKVTKAQVELFELAYLNQLANVARTAV